ncbi:MAG: LysR family transcriptional regulator [Deltaproteobacteria bacterium]|nr:LysR family transcriptional regulator [Deltaproteobacteria bacterium]
MLDELRHFLLIVENGTFTEAARRAHLSQPALTASIRRLEDLHGARLFHRGRGGTSLTAEGRALLPSARTALAAVETGRRAVAEVAGLRAGEVRIGAGATACTYLLPPFLAAFRKKYPGVRLHLREATTPMVIEALAGGQLDLGIVTHPDGEPWFSDELILIAAPSSDTSHAPFLTFPRGATSRDLFDRHFPSANIVMELGSISAVKGNVRAGIGMALVSRSAVQADVLAGRLVEVPHKATPITRMLSILHQGVDRLSPSASALRRLLLEKGLPLTPKSNKRPPSGKKR